MTVFLLTVSHESPQVFDSRESATAAFDRLSESEQYYAEIEEHEVKSDTRDDRYLGDPDEVMLLKIVGTNGGSATWIDGCAIGSSPWDKIAAPDNWRELIGEADLNTYGRSLEPTEVGTDTDWQWYESIGLFPHDGLRTGTDLLAAIYVGD